MKKRTEQKQSLHRIKLGGVRQDQKEQGFFDGRFVQRAEPSEKVYRRHNKHRNRPNDEL
jgi:uncharacterized protein YcgL (UPF0745 family)